MLKFVSPKLVIRNHSRKTITVLGIVPIKPNKEILVDIFQAIPNLSEAKVIDAMRAPHGQLYVESKVNRTLEIVECVLSSFQGYEITPDQLKVTGVGKDGQVLAIDSVTGDFKWVFHNENDRLTLEPPLAKDKDNIYIPKADKSTNGYLAKEDWVLFKGKSQGIRIWQYQDFKAPVKSSLKLSSFENGSSVGSLGFNEDYIVDGSAVIINLKNKDKAPLNNASFLGKFSKGNDVFVQQHRGSAVVLEQSVDENLDCRVYFLVLLPHTVDIPADYEAPNKFVRDQRIELMDSIDIDVMGSKMVRGSKRFTNSIIVNESLGVRVENPEYALDINGIMKGNSLILSESPTNHYSLVSNAMGEAKWESSPMVSPIPPNNNYDGQIWVRAPDYEVFVFDGIREKWLSLDTLEVSGAKNSTSCENVYLHILDNIPSNVNSTVLPWNATLVGLIASSETKQNWTAEVHLEGSVVSKAILPIMSSDRSYNNKFNLDFRAGDKIQLFVSGRDISMPHIKALFRKKV